MRLLLSALFKQESSIDEIFDEQQVVNFPEDLDSSGVLILWGGEDISPTIYGEVPCSYTDADEVISVRDRLEIDLAKEAIRKNIPIVGICRGAQLMCALSGGTVIQHVSGHAGPNHAIQDKWGIVMMTNSVHHQMMNPGKVDHQLVAWANPKRSKFYIGSGNKELNPLPKEPEIVYFPHTKALCIQGHPEFASATNEFRKYCNQLIKRYIFPQ